jgi:hypothetical protein
MAISSDYPHPVNVNGYSCKNCTDVDYAKKHIDPSHPKSGPYDVNADSDPSRQAAITFGGRLQDAKTNGTENPQGVSSVTSAQAVLPGRVLNISI